MEPPTNELTDDVAEALNRAEAAAAVGELPDKTKFPWFQAPCDWCGAADHADVDCPDPVAPSTGPRGDELTLRHVEYTRWQMIALAELHGDHRLAHALRELPSLHTPNPATNWHVVLHGLCAEVSDRQEAQLSPKARTNRLSATLLLISQLLYLADARAHDLARKQPTAL